MKHSRSLLVLIALLAVLSVPGALLAQGNGNGNGNGNNGNGNGNTSNTAFAHEPVLLYEVSGSTIAGPVSLVLTVYSDGEATLVSQDAPNVAEELCTATLTAAQVRELQRDLRQAGALRLRDLRSQAIPDVPLTTVTFFQNAGNSGRSVANTFSYLVPEDRYSDVEDVIREFIDEAFTC
jgi:hypothetical protein